MNQHAKAWTLKTNLVQSQGAKLGRAGNALPAFSMSMPFYFGELMHRGFVKLFRKTADSSIMKNAELLQLWTWCLMKATHKETSVLVGKQVVNLSPGQFVFGRKKAAEALNSTEKKIRNSMDALETMGNVCRERANKFSIITIRNWELYQDLDGYEGPTKGQQRASERANKGPTKGHKQEQQEQQEQKIKTKASEVPEWVPMDLFEAFKKMRREKKKPLGDLAARLAISKLDKMRTEGHDIRAVMEQTIYHCWSGFFPVKEETRAPTTEAPRDPEHEAGLARLRSLPKPERSF